MQIRTCVLSRVTDFSKRIQKQNSRRHFTVPHQKGYFGTKRKMYQATVELNEYAKSFRNFPPSIIITWQMFINFSLKQSANCLSLGPDVVLAMNITRHFTSWREARNFNGRINVYCPHIYGFVSSNAAYRTCYLRKYIHHKACINLHVQKIK
jgi:hypothetical protein